MPVHTSYEAARLSPRVRPTYETSQVIERFAVRLHRAREAAAPFIKRWNDAHQKKLDRFAKMQKAQQTNWILPFSDPAVGQEALQRMIDGIAETKPRLQKFFK